jgi:hypothetical protein
MNSARPAFALRAIARKVSKLLKNPPSEDTGPTKSVISQGIMQAACPHAAFLEHFKSLIGGFQAGLAVPASRRGQTRKRLPTGFKHQAQG